MKKPILRKTSLKFACLWMTVTMLANVTLSSFATGNPIPAKKESYYAISVKMTQTSKIHRARLYPDTNHQGLAFTVNGKEGMKYQLYVFDMDSRLVMQANIRNRETTVLNNISKGNYLFEVFTADEEVESGSMSVK